ncbi:hypothetical protein CEXT_206801 [Caerostris extrusa]|uniref:Uncharacterized protein n=1 Tax=Caerostris extrusa TaxID=172846 RepID=A0AAV4R391_CAEEX|nr:hypothetical protein CEXT_206801 [Caerostris extrusa]
MKKRRSITAFSIRHRGNNCDRCRVFGITGIFEAAVDSEERPRQMTITVMQISTQSPASVWLKLIMNEYRCDKTKNSVQKHISSLTCGFKQPAYCPLLTLRTGKTPNSPAEADYYNVWFPASEKPFDFQALTLAGFQMNSRKIYHRVSPACAVDVKHPTCTIRSLYNHLLKKCQLEATSTTGLNPRPYISGRV